MADTKVTALGSVTPILTDITYIVDDPGGTPASGKMTLQSLLDLFEANFAPSADVIPTADGTVDLGSATNRYAVVHTDSIDLNGVTLDGTTLADPGADRILFWDDSAGTTAYLTAGTGLSISGTTLSTTGLASLGANEFTGTQDFNGQQVEAHVSKVVTSVTGALTTTAHSGNILVTSGNVTVPTTAGFNCILIAGGAHTVTFNSTTSAAMAAGDVMTIVVESGTVIHAVLTAAADKVSFT